MSSVRTLILFTALTLPLAASAGSGLTKCDLSWSKGAASHPAPSFIFGDSSEFSMAKMIGKPPKLFHTLSWSKKAGEEDAEVAIFQGNESNGMTTFVSGKMSTTLEYIGIAVHVDCKPISAQEALVETYNLQMYGKQ